MYIKQVINYEVTCSPISQRENELNEEATLIVENIIGGRQKWKISGQQINSEIEETNFNFIYISKDFFE